MPDQIVRPPIDDFIALPFIFAWSGAAPFIALLLAAVIEPIDQIGWDMLFIIYPAILSWGAFVPVVQG